MKVKGKTEGKKNKERDVKKKEYDEQWNSKKKVKPR